MIIIYLQGGLGNQMFQYAFGRRLAFDRRVPLKLDLSWYGEQSLRRYRLNSFEIYADVASKEDIANVRGSNLVGFLDWFHNGIDRRLPYFLRRQVIEKSLQYDPKIVKFSRKNARLIGYWQCEKYFSSISTSLREEFKLNTSTSYEFDQWQEKILSAIAVSIHVRRGDYVTNPYTNQVHGTCNINYYTNAMAYLQQRYNDVIFNVFSDDIDWAVANLKSSSPVNYISLASDNRDVEELLLMSNCKHHIIANSSYSWWGAWLGNSAEKIVIAPRKWTNDLKFALLDILPDKWVVL